MAIFRKEHLAREKDSLAIFYRELIEALNGAPPSDTLAAHFQQTVDDFQREYTDIDLERLNQAIGHLRVSLEGLKKIKSKAQKPVHGR